MVIVGVTANAFAMDPWGGSVCEVGAEVDAGASVLGFDDDFADTLNSLDEKNDAETNSSSSPLPTSINFIPRLQSRSVESTILSAKNGFCSSSSSSLAPFPSLAPLKDPLTQMMTSEEYIARLEAKLKRVKGGVEAAGKKKCLSTSAKRMIEDIALVKISAARHLINGGDSISNSYCDQVELHQNILVQRAFPERTPLTAEELASLLKHDQLEASEKDEEAKPSF